MSVSRVWLTGILLSGVILGACTPAAPPAPAPTSPPAAAPPAAPGAPAAAPAAAPAPAAPAASPAAAPAAAPGAPAAAPAASPAAAAPAAKPANLTKITVGHGALSATDTPMWVAMDQGILAKNGLEIDYVLLNGGSQIAQALSSGSVPVAQGGLGALLDAELSGVELTVLGSPYPWQFFQIYAQPGIKTMEDLRGKTIAASDPGSSSDRAIIQVAQKYGLVPGKDFNVTYVGGTKERLQVLQQKVVDASIISPPNGLLAGKQGFVKVVDLVAEKIPFGYAGLAANTKWAKDNPQLLEAFLKSYVEGLSVAKANKQLGVQMIKKYAEIQDQDVAEEAYNLSVAVMPLIPVADPELIKLMLSLSEQPKAKTVDPTTLYDAGPFKRLVDSGFLKTLPVQQ
jgi:NitT/TauT family transport system substrate-binding protein